jgi:hypothetical protein
MVERGIGIDTLEQILLKFEIFAASRNLRAVEIRMPPLGYFPRFDKEIYRALSNLNWTESKDEIFSYINRDANLAKVMRKNRKYDVAWWERKDNEYKSGLEDMVEAHKIIALNFSERGRQNLMTLEKILELSKKMPHALNAHLLIANSTTVAAAITLEIDKQLTHIFKWANNPISEKQFPSALPLLFKRIFENKSNSSSGRICLGTSTDNAEINRGLLDFKCSLGFEITSRKVIRKELKKS